MTDGLLPRAAAGDPVPGEVASFQLVDRDLDERSGRVTLDYAFEGGPRFQERIELPPARTTDDAAALAGVLGLLHLAAGVSYYKTAFPPAVRGCGGPLAPRAQALAEGLYGPGLAEARYVNDLPLDPGALFGPPGTAPAGAATAPAAPQGEGVLVPLGGGKDSIVTIEALRRAGVPVTLFSVGDADPIRRTAQASGLPRLIARRRLDPRLLEANERWALNGHVPVTAIVSLIACLVAIREGAGEVVLSNERSARAGSVVVDGVEVNHQWSKGRDAERLLSAALAEAAGPRPRCFSLLRGASELAIARAFAREDRYDLDFTSCNRVFRLDPARRAARWCGDCDKCRFVFLALAPWCEPARLERIFGANLLDDPGQLPGFLALCGHGAAKPLECVGEVSESLAALRLLDERPAWREAAVVEAVRALGIAAHAPVDEVLALEDDEVPARFGPVVRAALAA
jgi:hypothetical protein